MRIIELSSCLLMYDCYYDSRHGAHGADGNVETHHIQEGFVMSAGTSTFTLKPYAGDDVTELTFQWETGFSGANLDDSTRAKVGANKCE